MGTRALRFLVAALSIALVGHLYVNYFHTIPALESRLDTQLQTMTIMGNTATVMERTIATQADILQQVQLENTELRRKASMFELQYDDPYATLNVFPAQMGPRLYRRVAALIGWQLREDGFGFKPMYHDGGSAGYFLIYATVWSTVNNSLSYSPAQVTMFRVKKSLPPYLWRNNDLTSEKYDAIDREFGFDKAPATGTNVVVSMAVVDWWPLTAEEFEKLGYAIPEWKEVK